MMAKYLGLYAVQRGIWSPRSDRRMGPTGAMCSAVTSPRLSFGSAFGGKRIARTAFSRRQHVVKGIFAANPVTGAAQYLAEAAKQIFSPTNTGDQPPWEGSGSAFTGSIAHHENSAERLRAIYAAVRSSREAITGCTDPEAANYNPAAMVDDGTCNYVAETIEETGLTEDLRSYVTNTLSRVWSHNFKGDDTEPKDWASMGYSYRGQKVSQRDIMRLLQYEKVVKKALDEAEAKEN